MNLKKFAPWNWFKKEDEEYCESLPARRIENRPTRGDAWFPQSLDQLDREMSRLFEDAFGEFGLPSSLPRLTGSDFFRPRVDIAANEKEYSITIEVPGINKKDVAIEVNDNTMTIRGEKRLSNQEQSKHLYRMERSYGSFQRVLSLPDDADQDHIKATFKNGLLTVTMPRRDLPRSGGTQIEIKAA